MQDYCHRIAKAAEILNNHQEPPKLRLVQAGNEFWAGLIYPDDWPLDLWEKAWRICELLLADGPIRMTVERMDAETADRMANQLGNDMAELAAGIEQAGRDGRMAPGPRC